MIRLDRFRAKSFFNTGEYEKALILYEKVVKESKSSRDRMSLARIYMKAGRFDDAEAQLRKLNLADLNAVEGIQAKISLAQTIWRKGDLKDAIRRVELIFQTEKITLVYATLGYLYIVAGDKKALDFNQEAYAYNPANAEIGDNLGECLLATKDYAKALEIYEAIAKMKVVPIFPEWRYHYGLTLEKLDRPADALVQLKFALAAKYSALSTLDPATVQKVIGRIEAAVASPAAVVGPGA